MGINYNTRIPRDSLVLLLDRMNPKSYPGSGNIWFDISGQGHHVTLVNNPTVTSQAISFNGVDQYGEVDPALKAVIEASTDFTIVSFPVIKHIEHVDNLIGWGNANSDGTGYRRTWGQYASDGQLGTSYGGPSLGGSELYNKNLMLVSQYEDHVYHAKVRGEVTSDDTVDFTGSTNKTWKGISTSWPITIGKTNYYNRWMEMDLRTMLLYNRLLTEGELKRVFDAYRGRYGL